MGGVRIESVTKRFADNKRGPIEALKDVSVDVRDGELVVFVGPSGCGKTTLLRVVAGLENVDAGNVLIDGRVVNDLEPKDRNVAMVFQDYALYPHMSVYENLAFTLRARRTPKDGIDAEVRRVAGILGIDGVLDRRPKQLSGGQRQRVAVGRAIVRSPKAFLFDEPLSNLDAQLRVQMRAELAELHRRLGATMLYVTHDQVEAMTLGDRIVVMDQGAVQQVGTPSEVYREPANVFVARFIGSPPMNVLPEPSGTRLLGLRPEDLRILPPGDRDARLFGYAGRCEHLGSEKLVHATVGTTPIIIRVAPQSPTPEAGAPISLAFSPGSAIYFDAHTGLRMSFAL